MPPFRPEQAQAADPALVQALTQKQGLMQRPHTQHTSADKCVMSPQQHFDGSNPSTARIHLVAFEKYFSFQTRQGTSHTFHEFKNMFALTLTDITLN